ncbi:MAG: hypothetical protein ABI723_05650 [Bacteroidia bacterium]
MDRISNFQKTNKGKANQWPLITDVEYAGDYYLYVKLSDESARMINMYPMICSADMYKPFLNKSSFRKFKFTDKTIYWPGNVLDRHIKHIL